LKGYAEQFGVFWKKKKKKTCKCERLCVICMTLQNFWGQEIIATLFQFLRSEICIHSTINSHSAINYLISGDRGKLHHCMTFW